MEPDNDLSGLRIGNYRVLSQIGQGGMGVVYLAHHEVLGRQAAVKVLLPELSKSPDLVARFFDEARATAQLKHRGFVEIFDSGTLPNGSAYLIMDFLRGTSLATCIERQGTLPIAETVAILREVATSVGIAHRRGIVHRDLKPDNVFLAMETQEDGGPEEVAVKVLDFGIAKLTSPDQKSASGPRRTRTGTLLGTPLFMSPEQCRGAGQVDHRSDIYSLGCIAYNMLAGRAPFEYEGFGEIISAHLHESPRPLRAILPELPDTLDQLVRELLAKSPADRPQTMEAVTARLDGIPGLAQAPDLSRLIPAQALNEPVMVPTRTASQGARAVAATTPFPRDLPPTQPGPRHASGETRLLPQERAGRSNNLGTLGTAAAEIASFPEVRTGRRFGAPLIAILALGGVGAGVFFFLQSHRPAPAADVVAASPAPAPQASALPRSIDPPQVAEPEPPKSPKVEKPHVAAVQLSSAPPHATVVDANTGEVLGSTPLAVQMLPSSRERAVEVRRHGFRSAHLTLTPETRPTLTVTLEKIAAESKPHVSSSGDDDDRRKL